MVVFEPNVLMKLEGVNPAFDWHPYTLWPCFTFPGRLLPQGIPDNLWPLQNGINFTMSRIRETHRMMGHPKWFITHGTGIKKGQITNETGEPVFYNTGSAPPYAYTPPPLPAYVFHLMDRLEGHADRVSAQPPITRGENQGQVRSGLQAAILQEQSLSEFTPMVERLSEAKIRHRRQLLMREIQFAEVPRRIQYQEASGAWEQDLFFAKNMAPDFSIVIDVGSDIPQSPANEMARVSALVGMGALQPQAIPSHAEAIGRALHFNVPTVLPQDVEANVRSAHYRITQLLRGEMPLVSAVDDHRIHVNEIIRFMRTQRFREMAEQDPTLHPIFMNLLGKHMGYIQMQQAGLVVPQPVIPFEDLSAQLPEGQAQSLMSQMGGGGQNSGGPAGRPSGNNFSDGAGAAAPSGAQGISAPPAAPQIQGS